MKKRTFAEKEMIAQIVKTDISDMPIQGNQTYETKMFISDALSKGLQGRRPSKQGQAILNT